MPWRDIRTNPMTADDADERGDVYQLLNNNETGFYGWESVSMVIAWMPTEEWNELIKSSFIPTVSPPEGWRRLGDEEAFDERAKLWTAGNHSEYIIPIDLPISSPDGWRLVVKGDAFDKRAKILIGSYWETTNNNRNYTKDGVYIVPIDPPKPTYRPFANAAEFEPFKNMWWMYKANGQNRNEQCPPIRFNDRWHGNDSWERSFEAKVFINGTPEGLPFGVKE